MMKREKLCTLILTVISTLSVLTLNIVSAGESSIIFPKEVFLNESFNVTINSSLETICDVKIFIKENKTTEKSSSMLSFIFDKTKNKWTNPYFYIENSFPAQKTYLIKAHSFKEETEICLKLRSSSSKKVIFSDCQAIKINNETKNLFADENTKISDDILKKVVNSSEKIEFQTRENKIRKNIFLLFLLYLAIVFILIILKKI